MQKFKFGAASLGSFASLIFVSFACAQTATVAPHPAPLPAKTSPAATPVAAPPPKIFGQTYGDWIYRCAVFTNPDGSKKQSCVVAQQNLLSKGGKLMPLLTITISRSAKKTHLLNILAPLAVLLKPGVEISVDQDKAIISNYDFCTSAGCWAVDQPAEGFIPEIRQGHQGHAKFTMLSGNNIAINFSLKGGADAMNALDSGALPKPEAAPQNTSSQTHSH